MGSRFCGNECFGVAPRHSSIYVNLSVRIIARVDKWNETRVKQSDSLIFQPARHPNALRFTVYGGDVWLDVEDWAAIKGIDLINGDYFVPD